MSALDHLLQSYRQAAVTEREKGTYFERLVVAFLRNDPVQCQQYSEVWSFADWAKANGLAGNGCLGYAECRTKTWVSYAV